MDKLFTLAGIHRFDCLNQKLAIAFDIFNEYEEQFQGRLGHQTVFTRNQRVEPLDCRVVLHDAVHSVNVEHHLAQSYTDVNDRTGTKKRKQ